ncbi:MAG: hypothetical protein B6D62_01245 [Candidatus Cloacimonas sp. 4484_275]|nr:MAG: hypothetical protein B6D62_01245 [Candidatus Cloacimonas sp. 4484_275]RLC53035.1 MAG: response regulator [Candidatus Cloacimonadota bacterium]
MPLGRILITEDERIIAEDLKMTLQEFGYDVIGIVASGEEAIAETKRLKPDLILMDIMLDGKLNGIETAKDIFIKFKIPVIYITAYADSETLDKAKKTKPFGFLFKPFEEEELFSTLEFAINKIKSN